MRRVIGNEYPRSPQGLPPGHGINESCPVAGVCQEVTVMLAGNGLGAGLSEATRGWTAAGAEQR